MADKLATSLQVAVLAALSFDAGHGAAISAVIKPDHFDGVYRDFVTRVLTYRKRYGKPPGKSNVADIAAQTSFGRDNSVVRQRLVPQLLAEAEGLNAEYVATRAQDFIRRQVLKAALMEAGDRYGQDDDAMVVDVERILHQALRFRAQTLDAGLFLNDPRGLQFVEQQDQFISLDIPELDRMHIGLVPKELLLYIAPKGSGKTWFCVHCGRQALIQRQKVLHVSLEMDELKVFRRYYQGLFSVARKPNRFNRAMLDFDGLDRLSGFRTRRVKPKLSFSNPKIRKILLSKMRAFGTRLGGLVIKSFPTGQLTIDQLLGYLDYLEEVHDFVPHLLMVDYPKLMRHDRKNLRVDLGHTVEELRGIGSARNMAMVAPHQGTRAAINARRVTSSMAGEDISVVQTADTVLAFSRTKAEERLGLGRLSVEHARDTEGQATILLVQSYDTGQYVLDSALMNQAYWERLNEVAGEQDEES
jgi:hypothetical protein